MRCFLSDGYTVSDVVMYWRDEPVVGVEDAELPQFTIVGWETNERKIKLATGKYFAHRGQFHKSLKITWSVSVKCVDPKTLKASKNTFMKCIFVNFTAFYSVDPSYS